MWKEKEVERREIISAWPSKDLRTTHKVNWLNELETVTKLKKGRILDHKDKMQKIWRKLVCDSKRQRDMQAESQKAWWLQWALEE